MKVLYWQRLHLWYMPGLLGIGKCSRSQGIQKWRIRSWCFIYLSYMSRLWIY